MQLVIVNYTASVEIMQKCFNGKKKGGLVCHCPDAVTHMVPADVASMSQSGLFWCDLGYFCDSDALFIEQKNTQSSELSLMMNMKRVIHIMLCILGIIKEVYQAHRIRKHALKNALSLFKSLNWPLMILEFVFWIKIILWTIMNGPCVSGSFPTLEMVVFYSFYKVFQSFVCKNMHRYVKRILSKAIVASWRKLERLGSLSRQDWDLHPFYLGSGSDKDLYSGSCLNMDSGLDEDSDLEACFLFYELWNS